MTDQEELYAQQMEERWQELQRAQDRNAPAAELERIYGSYLDALDGYNAAVREADREQTTRPSAPSASESGESFAAAVQRMWVRLGAIDEDALDPSGERDPEADLEE